MVIRPRRLLAAASAALAAGLAAGLTACGASPAKPSNVITVSSNQCGGGWSVPGPGWHTFEIDNQSTGGGEIDLINPANGAIYAEVENTGPGTVTPVRVNLGSGTYASMCNFNDFNTQVGEKVTVGGHAKGTPAILPVSYNDTIPYAKKYQAYGTFGGYDGEIDGDANAIGVNSPDWTGFYRLEYGLWHGQPVNELAPVAATLEANVKALLAWWPKQQIPLSDAGLRTHEILENALQFQLTGNDDYGSGTTLATTLANIQGTRYLLTLLHPLLAPRYAGLPAVNSGLDQLQSLINKEHLRSGSWVPVSRLPAAMRRAIDAACGAVLQSLAPIASIAEPRNTASDF